MVESGRGEADQSSFDAALAALKRRGCNVLVAGAVPDRDRDLLSARFLGDPAAGPRVRLFGLVGRGVETARRRLSLAGPGAAPVRVVVAGDGHRATTAADTASPAGLSVERVADGRVLREGLVAAVADLEDGTGPFGPGDLRVCVDSLRALAEEEGVAAVESLVSEVGDVVRAAGGMAHYVYPGAHDAAAAEVVAPSFDAVVSLRVRKGQAEQHWYLPDRAVKTGWFPLDGGPATRD